MAVFQAIKKFYVFEIEKEEVCCVIFLRRLRRITILLGDWALPHGQQATEKHIR
jgi:hypothetical protein